MSRNKQQQGVHQWNPPPIPKESGKVYDQPQNVLSATECTGLGIRPAQDKLQAEALSDLCAIHQMKPQGNIGKGNPNNDPSEIAFHRRAESADTSKGN